MTRVWTPPRLALGRLNHLEVKVVPILEAEATQNDVGLWREAAQVLIRTPVVRSRSTVWWDG